MFALVFFPIPTLEQAGQLSGYHMQLIPFYFVADIIRKSPLVITNIHTYLPAVFNRTVLQVVFNVIMTVPRKKRLFWQNNPAFSGHFLPLFCLAQCIIMSIYGVEVF